MKFRDYFSLKHILFALLLFALLIPIALWDSNTQVKVSFYDTSVTVKADRYSMSILYEDIASAELTELAEEGEKVEDGFGDDIIRTGVWHNDTWGEYIIVADLDATNCVLLKLTDGRTLVFSQKNNETTAEVFDTLLTYLPNA